MATRIPARCAESSILAAALSLAAATPVASRELPAWLAGEALVFENTAHDFPQRVRYTPVGTDRIDASIEGIVDGKPRVERWQYVRE